MKLILYPLLLSVSTAGHVCIIDAGSSGSRGHCFEQIQEGTNSANVTELFSPLKNSIPLSDFAANPSAAGASLSGIFAGIEAGLIEVGVDSAGVELFVLATAGMRLVSESPRNAIFASVRNAARNLTELKVGDGCCHAIPGEYEGAFGLLAASFLLGGAHVGAIDLGGASTQLTLRPDASTSLISGGMFAPFTVLGGDGDPVGELFTQSKLRFGNDQFRERLLSYSASLRGLAEPDGTVQNPCLPQGYNQSSGGGPAQFGSGDAAGCARLVSEFLGSEGGGECIVEPCSFAGFYSPPLPAESPTAWVLTGTFYYIWNDLLGPPPEDAPAAAAGAADEIGGVFTAAELLEKVEDLCGWPAEFDAEGEFVWGDGHDDLSFEYSKYYCLSGLYMHYMLAHYGFADNAKLHALDEVGGTTVEWPLGAALASTSMGIPL